MFNYKHLAGWQRTENGLKMETEYISTCVIYRAKIVALMEDSYYNGMNINLRSAVKFCL